MLAARVMAIVAGVVLAHSPTPDGHLADWCLYETPRVDNRSAVLYCPFGTEVVWWDAPADGAVNDLALVATTQDSESLYWAVGHHAVFDPILLPFVELAVDVGLGGNNAWWDPQGVLQAPGHCSVDTSRLCTDDQDCHFCTFTLEYEGTPNERPRVCGSTDKFDTCDWLNPDDVCIRTQTCEGLAEAPAAPSVGTLATSTVAPDYLFVIDFGRWLIGVCDAVNMLRNDNGTWVEIPRPVPDPFCPNPTWRFTIPIGPGTEPRPPEYELEVPWEAFVCDGCVPFGPGDDFRWTMAVSRGLFTFDYTPDGPIEDVMSEAVAGTWTTTPDGCDTAGSAATLCELADGSSDAFVPLAPRAPGGQVDGLVLERNEIGTATPSITLTWHPSCSNTDNDYAVYEGELGVWYSHVEP
ncbi:MAG: hypothetical protein R3344_07535, partial [Acidobacteriota bacterium]|nr:hypothetical protein [Acidobacteriota bacterium]